MLHTHLLSNWDIKYIWIYLQKNRHLTGSLQNYFFNPLDNWMAYIIQLNDYWPLSSSTRFCVKFMRLFPRNSEIAMNICKTWLAPEWYRKKTPHFEKKKALKTLFHNKKTLQWKKAQKNHLFFKNTCWEDCRYALVFCASYLDRGSQTLEFYYFFKKKLCT